MSEKKLHTYEQAYDSVATYLGSYTEDYDIGKIVDEAYEYVGDGLYGNLYVSEEADFNEKGFNEIVEKCEITMSKDVQLVSPAVLLEFYKANKEIIRNQTLRPEVAITSFEDFIDEINNEISNLCFEFTGNDIQREINNELLRNKGELSPVEFYLRVPGSPENCANYYIEKSGMVYLQDDEGRYLMNSEEAKWWEEWFEVEQELIETEEDLCIDWTQHPEVLSEKDYQTAQELRKTIIEDYKQKAQATQNATPVKPRSSMPVKTAKPTKTR